MRTVLLLFLLSVLMACETSPPESDQLGPELTAESSNELVLHSDIEWGPLNPARGEKGPKAANLWGDRSGSGPSGFLVQFLEGFSSPPHIHNVTYRGLVISGLLHNDDPSADKMWLPAGSYWTQPLGQVHITAANGSNNLAYIEIEDGPYLVLPTEQASDNGERPVNIDRSNIVWVDASSIVWMNQPGMPAAINGPKVAFLWANPEDDQLNGTLIKLPNGFTGKIRSHGSSFRAVIIQGQPEYQLPGESEAKTLEQGSYFGSKGESVHQISSKAGEESIIYVRTDGQFEIIPQLPTE